MLLRRLKREQSIARGKPPRTVPGATSSSLVRLDAHCQCISIKLIESLRDGTNRLLICSLSRTIFNAKNNILPVRHIHPYRRFVPVAASSSSILLQYLPKAPGETISLPVQKHRRVKCPIHVAFRAGNHTVAFLIEIYGAMLPKEWHLCERHKRDWDKAL